MSIKSRIKTLEKELNEETKDEEAEVEGADDNGKVEGEDAAAEGSDKPEQKPEEQKPEEKPNYAKLRVDSKSKEKDPELTELKTKVSELTEIISKPKAEKTEEDPEPNKAEDHVAWLEWQNRQLSKSVGDLTAWQKQQAEAQEEQNKTLSQRKDIEEATQELGGYIAEFAKEKGDTAQVLEHLEEVLKSSVKNLFPQYNATQVQQAVNYKILQIAGHAYNKGYDPASVLYQMGIERGYTPKQADKKDDTGKKAEESKKPDLDALKKAKERSAHPAAGGGQQKQGMTVEEFRKLPLAKKAKMTKEEIDALMANAD